MLATRISYINDLAVVAEKLGIDIEHVRQGMAADSRIGASYMYPGAGFGGENFSHDVLTLANTVSTTGVKSQLLAQVWEINEQQKELLFRKLWVHTAHGQLLRLSDTGQRITFLTHIRQIHPVIFRQ